MNNPFLSGSYIPVPGWINLLAIHMSLSFITAFALGRQRTIGFLRSFILCLLVTAPVGCIILLFYPTLKQNVTNRTERIADSGSVDDYLLRLKLFKQTGMISKVEYDVEKKRIMEWEHKKTAQHILLYKHWKRGA